ncbi:hypothetical protein RRG08_010809 [Elysia crispata]|uniref:Uncharacterized protein n=1 Tax=Elysia crispata TaxID=231223 RepID=A0AAE0ZEX8_9GAST|nr:hypothetical protein RRG08_010809 [Elysia crispata]
MYVSTCVVEGVWGWGCKQFDDGPLTVAVTSVNQKQSGDLTTGLDSTEEEGIASCWLVKFAQCLLDNSRQNRRRLGPVSDVWLQVVDLSLLLSLPGPGAARPGLQQLADPAAMDSPSVTGTRNSRTLGGLLGRLRDEEMNTLDFPFAACLTHVCVCRADSNVVTSFYNAIDQANNCVVISTNYLEYVDELRVPHTQPPHLAIKNVAIVFSEELDTNLCMPRCLVHRQHDSEAFSDAVNIHRVADDKTIGKVLWSSRAGLGL